MMRTKAPLTYSCTTMFILIMAFVSAHGQGKNIPYDKLKDCQEKRFRTFHPTSAAVGSETWNSLNDSRRYTRSAVLAAI
jgi:hypothetical protein